MHSARTHILAAEPILYRHDPQEMRAKFKFLNFFPTQVRFSAQQSTLVACPHRLPKLPKSTQRKQAIPNKGSLTAHCSIVTVICP
jgi:hypothetical protein